jgi:hypothetical protein
MKSPSNRPWEREPEESKEAYDSFLIYRNLGRNRSLESACQKSAGSVPLLKRWSKQWKWVSRALAWDDFLQRARDDEHLSHAAKWEQRRIQAVEEAWEAGDALREKALQMLATPLVEKRSEKDGKTIILKPAKWSFQNVTDMLRLADELRNISTSSIIKPAEKCDADELDIIEEANREAKALYRGRGRGKAGSAGA